MKQNYKIWTLESDLDCVLDNCKIVFQSLFKAKIFLTGGTGFIGSWILETVRHANIRLNSNIRVVILTRNEDFFKKKAPHLADYKYFKFIKGDILDFKNINIDCSHIIHAATDASADLNENNPVKMFNTIVEGTRKILDFAIKKKPQKFLFLSSGAVYGPQPHHLERVSEKWMGGPNIVDPKFAYGEGKRAAEMLCSIYCKQFNLSISIARIFALLGPYLSLNVHFAAGNFIRDAIEKKKIIIKGNGMPKRSYLYPSDLVIWLLHILVYASTNKPYNLGSEEIISIKDLAELISKTLNGNGVKVLGAKDSGWNLGSYVPDANLIKKEMNLSRTVSLEESILRTAIWNGWKRN